MTVFQKKITVRKILLVRKLDDTQILCLKEQTYNYLYNDNILSKKFTIFTIKE